MPPIDQTPLPVAFDADGPPTKRCLYCDREFTSMREGFRHLDPESLDYCLALRARDSEELGLYLFWSTLAAVTLILCCVVAAFVLAFR
jgi:hypothetical protein